MVLLTATTCTPKATHVAGVQTSRAPTAAPTATPSTTVTPGTPSTPGSPRQTGIPARLASLNWLIATSALMSLLNLDPAAASQWFNNDRTMVIGASSRSVPAGWTSSHILTFPSLDAIRQAIAQGLPPDVRAIMYDIEGWSLTPVLEQQHPVASITTAAQLVHTAGLRFIAAPSVDLMGKLYPGQGPFNQSYVGTGFARAAAVPADVYVVQAQTYQNDTATYSDFVQQVATQARAGHPGVVVIAGLSTGPHGTTTTPDAMAAALTATVGVADGYWLNIPGPSAQCPTCAPPQPGVALDFLKRLGG